ncbi:MAG: hypothetical protein ACLP5H_22580 [Desulfomonilaceae bacterium]
MKKEARIQAEKMFLRSGGKITNREIGKLVKVNPLTVGLAYVIDAPARIPIHSIHGD